MGKYALNDESAARFLLDGSRVPDDAVGTDAYPVVKILVDALASRDDAGDEVIDPTEIFEGRAAVTETVKVVKDAESGTRKEVTVTVAFPAPVFLDPPVEVAPPNVSVLVTDQFGGSWTFRPTEVVNNGVRWEMTGKRAR